MLGILFLLSMLCRGAGRNHKRKLPVLFRKRPTCRVNLTHRPSELLTDRPQFCTRICLPHPSTIGHERYYSETPKRGRGNQEEKSLSFHGGASCCDSETSKRKAAR